MEVPSAKDAAIVSDAVTKVVGDKARVSRLTKYTLVLLIGTPEWADAKDFATGLSARGLSVGPGEIVIRTGSAGRCMSARSRTSSKHDQNRCGSSHDGRMDEMLRQATGERHPPVPQVQGKGSLCGGLQGDP